MFIVGSLVNVDRWQPKSLQMTGMPKSASSLLATRSFVPSSGSVITFWAHVARCLFNWNLVKDDAAGMPRKRVCFRVGFTVVLKL